MTLTIIAVVTVIAAAAGLYFHFQEAAASGGKYNWTNLKIASWIVAAILAVAFIVLAWGDNINEGDLEWQRILGSVAIIAVVGLAGWLIVKYSKGIWQIILLVLLVLALVAGLLFSSGQADNVFDPLDNSGYTALNPEGGEGLSISCAEDIQNGNYPSRVDGLVFPASGTSLWGVNADELFVQIGTRQSVGEVQRAFYMSLAPEQVAYGDLNPSQLNEWPAAFVADDNLSEEVMKRMCLLTFDAEYVSQDALGGETWKILTVLPAEDEIRPIVATVANFRMPVGGMNLWKLTPKSFGDSALEDVRSSYFEPSLGIFFIPAGVELGVDRLEGEIDLGDFFGEEEEAGEAADEAMAEEESTDSTEPSATDDTTEVTEDTTPSPEDTTSTTEGTYVPVTPETPGTTVPGPGTTVPGPGTTVPGPGTTVPCDGCGTTTVPTPTTTVPTPTTTCPSCGTTTTTVPVTTTTQPPTTTTTQPPTTTTTQPPTTTTTVPPVQPDFKPYLSGSGPWTLQLQLGNSGDFCGWSTPLGSTVHESDLTTNASGDKYLWVTGTPCNGTPAVTHKTNTVIFGY